MIKNAEGGDMLDRSDRGLAIDLAAQRVCVTNFLGSLQERDLTVPPNCRGFGRVRHFIRNRYSDWPDNPLPIDPACKALKLPRADILRAQVFQTAVCAWRCWYCYVPRTLLAADPSRSAMLTASELLDLWADEPRRPLTIDLTGGQPEIVPEWVPWIMRALRDRGLEAEVYLWSDDSLSNDFFWTRLSETDRSVVLSYQNYGRVCCFKGFDAASFSFNTGVAPHLHDYQFEIMRRLVASGMDLYAYVTLTTPRTDDLKSAIAVFVERLQQIDDNLPLRTVPLRINEFSPTQQRLDEIHRRALRNQEAVVHQWLIEIEQRYPSEIRELSIADVPLAGARR